ncbi:MAG: hypothetical protein L0219_09400, partial [Phycisphaerales bacterium]|nr:hypothetical protein [Phycisphaerales bacterium]
LNIDARVPVSGVIAHYNDETLPPGPNRLPLLMSTLIQKRIRMEGFIILDHYAERFDAFRRDMADWMQAPPATPRSWKSGESVPHPILPPYRKRRGAWSGLDSRCP